MKYTSFSQYLIEDDGGGDNSPPNSDNNAINAPADIQVQNTPIQSQGNDNFNSTANIDKIDKPIGDNIDRFDMPQILPPLYNDFISDMNNRGIKHEYKHINITDVKMKQSLANVYPEKINAIREKNKTNNNTDIKPILVSSDNYIIDGNHRWASCQSNTIHAHVIDLPFNDAYQFLYNKHYVNKVN